MTSHVYRMISAALCLLIPPVSSSAEVRDDYELTVAVAVKASHGWQLYRAEEFAGSFGNGHYTDPDPHTRVKDFWSDGLTAQLDRDGNGHHETVFAIEQNELLYVGSIGAKGTLVDTARDYRRFLALPVAGVLQDLRGEKAD